MKWELRTSWKYGNWIAQDGLIYVADRQAHALIGTGNDASPDSFLTVVDIRTAKELWRSETVQLRDRSARQLWVREWWSSGACHSAVTTTV